MLGCYASPLPAPCNFVSRCTVMTAVRDEHKSGTSPANYFDGLQDVVVCAQLVRVTALTSCSIIVSL